jgi:hypothetical protein
LKGLWAFAAFVSFAWAWAFVALLGLATVLYPSPRDYLPSLALVFVASILALTSIIVPWLGVAVMALGLLWMVSPGPFPLAYSQTRLPSEMSIPYFVAGILHLAYATLRQWTRSRRHPIP